MQAYVETPEGERLALGTPVVGNAMSGFHVYTENRPDAADRLLDIILQPGAAVGDGAVRWTNDLSEADNAKALAVWRSCQPE